MGGEGRLTLPRLSEKCDHAARSQDGAGVEAESAAKGERENRGWGTDRGIRNRRTASQEPDLARFRRDTEAKLPDADHKAGIPCLALDLAAQTRDGVTASINEVANQGWSEEWCSARGPSGRRRTGVGSARRAAQRHVAELSIINEQRPRVGTLLFATRGPPFGRIRIRGCAAPHKLSTAGCL